MSDGVNPMSVYVLCVCVLVFCVAVCVMHTMVTGCGFCNAIKSRRARASTISSDWLFIFYSLVASCPTSGLVQSRVRKRRIGFLDTCKVLKQMAKRCALSGGRPTPPPPGQRRHRPLSLQSCILSHSLRFSLRVLFFYAFPDLAVNVIHTHNPSTTITRK